MDGRESGRDGEARLFAVTGDLFFRSKIEATAAAAGVEVAVFAGTAELEEALARSASAIVLLDLGSGADDPAAAIAALKARRPAPTVVAFGSHRDRERLQAARRAGADRVLARSAFVARLPELLRG